MEPSNCCSFSWVYMTSRFILPCSCSSIWKKFITVCKLNLKTSVPCAVSPHYLKKGQNTLCCQIEDLIWFLSQQDWLISYLINQSFLLLALFSTRHVSACTQHNLACNVLLRQVTSGRWYWEQSFLGFQFFSAKGERILGTAKSWETLLHCLSFVTNVVKEARFGVKIAQSLSL